MLQLKNLTCGYGALQAVHGLDLDIPEGCVFALLGPNGAGKSSTLMSIAGHVDVFSGQIIFDGQDITAMPAANGCARASPLRRKDVVCSRT